MSKPIKKLGLCQCSGSCLSSGMCCSDALAVTEPDRLLASSWFKLFTQSCGALLPRSSNLARHLAGQSVFDCFVVQCKMPACLLDQVCQTKHERTTRCKSDCRTAHFATKVAFTCFVMDWDLCQSPSNMQLMRVLFVHTVIVIKCSPLIYSRGCCGQKLYIVALRLYRQAL